MSATDVNLTGTISASDGDVGGWQIGSAGIAKYTDDDILIAGLFSNFGNEFGNYPVGEHMRKDWTILVNDRFGVAEDGTLYADKAKISGELKASSGEIGGWTIDPDVTFYMSEFTQSYNGPALTTSWSPSENYIYTVYLTPMGVYTTETDNVLQETSTRFKSWWNLS